MPTVLRWKGYRFYFYSHEPHEPAHVHVDQADASAKFWLAPVALARNHGFGPPQLRELREAVTRHQHGLLEAWHGYSGTER